MCLDSHKFLGRMIGVTIRHIFYSPPKLGFFLAKGRQSVLILREFQELLILFKDMISEFDIDGNPSLLVFTYGNARLLKTRFKDSKSLPQSLGYFQISHSG